MRRPAARARDNNARPNCETARASSAFYYPTKVTRFSRELASSAGSSASRPHLVSSSCTRGSLQYLARGLHFRGLDACDAGTRISHEERGDPRNSARALTRSAKGARDPMTGMESNSVSLGRVSLDRHGFSAIIFQPTSALEFNNECSRTLERLRED